MNTVEQLRRLKFIDEELYWRGHVSRARIISQFGVSEDTAKADLRYYRKQFAPDLSALPGSGYRVPESWVPRLGRPNPEDYLRRLVEASEPSIPTAGLIAEVVPVLARRLIAPEVLQGLIRSLQCDSELQILYVSPKEPHPKEVWILPVGFLNDGFRWSCRCYRYDIGAWGEAVLDRIVDDKGARRPADPAKLGGDRDWNEIVVIDIAPNPGLSAKEAHAIREQYQFTGQSFQVSLRRCQLVYFLKRYQLEEPVTFKAPHQAPLVILNREQVISAIPSGMRVPLSEGGGLGKLLIDARRALPGLSDQQIIERALADLNLSMAVSPRTEESLQPNDRPRSAFDSGERSILNNGI